MLSLKTGATTAWNQIREDFFVTGDAALVLSRRTETVDAIVLAGFEEFLAPAFPEGLALLAVGGYGRRELFPHSDIDLLILADKGVQGKTQKDAVSVFLRELWDSGLRLSHSVHTIDECCELHEQNVELNVSLLDQRYIAGDGGVYRDFQLRLPKFLRSANVGLAKHLCKLARARHAKFQDTIYHMEPNIKEVPGGLRDLHTLWWLRQIRQTEVATEEWNVGLAPARAFLHSLRCFLHYRVGRDSNLLSFELQDEITQQSFIAARNPGEWMRTYFRHARDIYRTTTRAVETAEGPGGSMLSQFRDWRSRLSNSEFTVSRERLLLRVPQQLAVDPPMLLRLFTFVARHGIQLALDTERRIEDASPALAAYFAASRPIWPAINEILSLPHAALALAAMHETGALTAVFPEWKRIECLVVRDFYHRYTVDEHTLVTIQNLMFLRETADPERRRFADLFAEIQKPAVLLFALLFHDIGKGGGEGKHIEASRPIVHAAMQRIQAPAGVQRAVWDLIEQHVALSAVMNGRDLDDPSTAVELTAKVGTIEQLKRLTLLTYADISGVNPTAMSPWRLEQLWRVYLCAHRELTRELEAVRIETPAVRSPEQAGFLEGFPVRYLRTHNEEQIARHLEMEQLCGQSGVAVEIQRLNGFFIAEIVAHDRPGLFASIAGAISSFGMNILKAEAFANKRGNILDSFVFSDPGHNLELNPTEVDRLRLTIERVVTGRTDVRELLRNRPAPAPLSRHTRLRPAVNFNNETSTVATLIEVVTEDRPGLLYSLTGQLSRAGCNIEVVLIDTEANKALDVFYVTHEGRKLSPDQLVRLKQGLLAACGS